MRCRRGSAATGSRGCLSIAKSEPTVTAMVGGLQEMRDVEVPTLEAPIRKSNLSHEVDRICGVGEARRPRDRVSIHCKVASVVQLRWWGGGMREMEVPSFAVVTHYSHRSHRVGRVCGVGEARRPRDRVSIHCTVSPARHRYPGGGGAGDARCRGSDFGSSDTKIKSITCSRLNLRCR